MSRESAYVWVCESCGHKWLAKTELAPSQCAKCRTRGWHKTLTVKELVRAATWEQQMEAIAQRIVDKAREEHAAKLAIKKTAAVTTDMPMGSGASLDTGQCGKRFRIADTGQWWLCGKIAGHKVSCGGDRSTLDHDQMDD
jgi:hypothetical protein